MLSFLQVKEICEPLIISTESAKEIMKRFLADIELGLGAKTHKDAIVKCFVTYVQDLPTGKGTLRRIKQLKVLCVLN
jgi:hexokinase